MFERQTDEEVGHVAGDLIFVLRQRPHSHFTRDGNDLRLEHPLTLKEVKFLLLISHLIVASRSVSFPFNASLFAIDCSQALTGFEFRVKGVDGKTLYARWDDVVAPGDELVIVGEGMPIPFSRQRGSFPVFLFCLCMYPCLCRSPFSLSLFPLSVCGLSVCLLACVLVDTHIILKKSQGNLRVRFTVTFPKQLDADTRLLLSHILPPSRPLPKELATKLKPSVPSPKASTFPPPHPPPDPNLKVVDLWLLVLAISEVYSMRGVRSDRKCFRWFASRHKGAEADCDAATTPLRRLSSNSRTVCARSRASYPSRRVSRVPKTPVAR